MKLKSNQIETWYTCSLWYDLSNLKAKLDFWPQFHGPLNIENESAGLRLKFLVKVAFNEVEVQSTWNLVQCTHVHYGMIFLILMPHYFLPNFTVHQTLKIIVQVGHLCTFDTFLLSFNLKKNVPEMINSFYFPLV